MEMEPQEELPPEVIAQEASLLQHLPARPPGRDAELAREAASLNRAVLEAARELGFDDQPGDFLALLVALRDPGDAR